MASAPKLNTRARSEHNILGMLTYPFAPSGRGAIELRFDERSYSTHKSWIKGQQGEISELNRSSVLGRCSLLKAITRTHSNVSLRFRILVLRSCTRLQPTRCSYIHLQGRLKQLRQAS